MNNEVLGNLVAKEMEELEEAEGEIRTAMVIIEISKPEGQVAYRSRCTDGRLHVQLGMLEVARDISQVTSDED